MLQTSEAAQSQKVKVYLRNNQKIAKIMTFPSMISAQQLYQQSAHSYNIPVGNLHLYYGGNPINPEDSVPLHNNTIIHVVDCQKLKQQVISVYVKRLETGQSSLKFEIPKSKTVKSFIDQELFSAFGVKSTEVFLVHLGRQLKVLKTLEEQEVENETELICVNYQQQAEQLPKEQSRQSNTNNYQIGNQEQIVVNVGIPRDPSISSKPKDIYPLPDFTIDIPNDIESTYRLNLIFDSKIRKSSSIQGIDFEPEDIIDEEEELQLAQRTSYHSEDLSDNKSHRKHGSLMSEYNVRSQHEEEELISKHKKHSMIVVHDKKLEGGDLIYSGELEEGNGNTKMKELISEFKHRARQLRDEQHLSEG